MISLHEGRGPGGKKPPRAKVLVLRLTVAAIQPRIWRRLLVRETMWLSRLHEAVQVLFGWYDYQTHLFFLGDKRYGNPMEQGSVVIEDDRDVTLADVRLAEQGRGAYDYLFADGWHVDIRLEKTAAAEKGATYPRCVAGERAGPPEDCGGIEAYKDLLYCLKHPETDLGREWREWLGPAYDPEKCDLTAINKALRRLAK
ncbi:MAG TPA: plasmid pRiA4b ORF-3 family protein [Opitutaceae bacterium]|nr:plasmid pRiA4b ORF-3 family protein [Opitutaceae bacterium]